MKHKLSSPESSFQQGSRAGLLPGEGAVCVLVSGRSCARAASFAAGERAAEGTAALHFLLQLPLPQTLKDRARPFSGQLKDRILRS